jgi:hypothetical protein
MKKIMLITLVLVIVATCSFGSVAFAQEQTNSPDVHFARSDFNLDAFYQNAQFQGIDSNGTVTFKSAPKQVGTYSGITEVADSSVSVIPLTDEAAQEIRSLLASSNYRQVSDVSGTITMYSTSYWDFQNGLKGQMVRLGGFSGGISAGGSGAIVGSGVTITSQAITYGADGWADGGRVVSSQNVYPSNSTRSWSYSNTTPWIYVDSRYAVGQNYAVGLTRGSTWYTELSNNY